MEYKGNPAWRRFRQDIKRYLSDYHLTSPVKLLLVVDFWPVLLLRLEEWSASSRKPMRFSLNFLLLFLRPFIQGMSGTRIFYGAQIGGGFLLHTSVGIVITAKAVIGENCTLFAGASVVHKADGLGSGAPSIGNNVMLMAGSKIIGAVTIGDNAVVGANAVVLQNVPNNGVAVGVPATVREKI